jgi:hypothetical protein
MITIDAPRRVARAHFDAEVEHLNRIWPGEVGRLE